MDPLRKPQSTNEDERRTHHGRRLLRLLPVHNALSGRATVQSDISGSYSSGVSMMLRVSSCWRHSSSWASLQVPCRAGLGRIIAMMMLVNPRAGSEHRDSRLNKHDNTSCLGSKVKKAEFELKFRIHFLAGIGVTAVHIH